MKENIILISPALLSGKDRTFREKYTIPALGLLSISSILKMHGHDVTVIDFYYDRIYSKDEFLEKIRLAAAKGEPTIFGISVLTEICYDAYKIARLIRRMYPKAKIIAGGPHVTFMYEELLNDCEAIDIGVLNEGEATIVELIEHFKYPEYIKKEDILGIAYRADNTIKRTPSRPYVTYLDSFPFPDFATLDYKYGPYGQNVLTFISSRGCPGNCTFCASRALSGEKYRMNSAEWMISLVYYFYANSRIDSVGIIDDTFVANRSRLKKFCDYLQQLKMQIVWTCKSRVDTIHEESMRLISEAGCRSVHIGCESGDDEILKSINKKITVEGMLDAIEIINKYQMRAECSFIVGHHTDTLETIEKTIFLAHAIREYEIGICMIGINTPLPGTYQYINADKIGLKLLTKEWNKYDLGTPVFETENFTAEDIKKAQYSFSVDLVIFKDDFCFSGKDLSEYKRNIVNKIKNIKYNTQVQKEVQNA
jgi:radical SAM superfamily enzyme YgiQ (UPF0313 family)